MRLVKILRRGEVVIPKEVRNLLDWRAGDLLVPEVQGCRLILVRVEPPRRRGRKGRPEAAGDAAPAVPAEAPDLAPEESRLYGELGDLPLHPDELCRRSGLPITTVLSALGRLEMLGMVRFTPGGRLVRAESAGDKK